MRNRYETMFILEWGRDEGYWTEPEELEYVNKHAYEFWDAPVNTVFPYGYFVKLTPAGEAAGAMLTAEHRQRFLHTPKAGDFITGANAVVAAIVAVAGAIGYGIGYYKGQQNPRKAPLAHYPSYDPTLSPAGSPPAALTRRPPRERRGGSSTAPGSRRSR